MSLALTATLAMLVQQAFATFTRGVVPVLAPPIGAELGIDPSHAGSYTALAAAAAMAGTVGVGGFLRRYGGFRVSQVSLAIAGAGVAMGAPFGVVAIALGGLLVGFGSTISTPASSHVLARVVPRPRQPLYFSIKQTGVPLGVAMTGALAPAFAALAGWRGSLALCALLCLVLAVALEPWRARFDTDRDPTAPLGLAAIGETIRSAWSPGIGGITAMAMCYVGLQFVHTSFVVVFLVETQGRSLAAAGGLFSIGTLVAIPGRILWGWLGGRYVAPRRLLAGIGFGTAAAFAALALLPASASDALALAAVVLNSATVMAFHGLMLAEVARLAPQGRAGPVTGGVLFFAQIGQIVLPPLFGLLAVAAGYAAAWLVFALPALVMGAWLWRDRP
ncbi:MFS transporter [Elioraea sp. Yellowstone]|uniref:MFS transporter n=1 Tax=Elioraea sp. Yellowstone TaxID=2592070 RepID=UPI00114F51E0|nr:MFS transporter [Elioraea sp. Yellowstone]TQF76896.1 MFS transporter [Elioraea sp. Yellowstone]